MQGAHCFFFITSTESVVLCCIHVRGEVIGGKKNKFFQRAGMKSGAQRMIDTAEYIVTMRALTNTTLYSSSRERATKAHGWMCVTAVILRIANSLFIHTSHPAPIWFLVVAALVSVWFAFEKC